MTDEQHRRDRLTAATIKAEGSGRGRLIMLGAATAGVQTWLIVPRALHAAGPETGSGELPIIGPGHKTCRVRAAASVRCLVTNLTF
jgi:hypothetical protein